MPRYKKFIKEGNAPNPLSAHKRFRRWLWLGGLSAVAAVVVGLFIIKAGAGNAQTVAPEVAGAPHLAVVQDQFDLGTINLGNTVETVFRVRNTGDKPLLILKQPIVQVVEGCCAPRAVVSSWVIDPGQEGTITLDFMMHTGMGGKHRFDINLVTNDPTQPSKLLVVLSNWV